MPIINPRDARDLDILLKSFFESVPSERHQCLRRIFTEKFDFNPSTGKVSLDNPPKNITLPSDAERIASMDGVNVIYIPYRCLVPIKVDGLLVAGRSFGSDAMANNMANLIPHCIANGQASGTAAGLAVKHGIDVREVNIPELQANLVKQGVKLPRIKTVAAA